jgi:hypothetical protein
MQYETATRNAAIDPVGVLCDGGDIQFRTSGDNEVATCDFSATAFGDPASGTITANTISDDTTAVGGTIAKAVLRKSDTTVIATLSVTATGGGGDIEVTSLVVAAGEKFSVSSVTLTQPAGSV